MNSETRNLDMEIQHLEDCLLRCKGYEYAKMEAIQSKLTRLRIQKQKNYFNQMRSGR